MFEFILYFPTRVPGGDFCSTRNWNVSEGRKKKFVEFTLATKWAANFNVQIILPSSNDSLFRVKRFLFRDVPVLAALT